MIVAVQNLADNYLPTSFTSNPLPIYVFDKLPMQMHLDYSLKSQIIADFGQKWPDFAGVNLAPQCFKI